MTNPFKNMPASKKPPVVVAPQPPVILAEQPASTAPAKVTMTALPKMPQAKAKAATPEVVVATPAPVVAQETHDEFKQRQIKESVKATAAAVEDERRAKMARDFGTEPAVNAEPTVLTDDELEAVDEESVKDVAEVFSQDHEEVERDVVVVEARDPELRQAPKRDSFKVTLDPLPLPKKPRVDNVPRVIFPPRPVVLEVYYDESKILRLVRDDRLLTAEEIGRLPQEYRLPAAEGRPPMPPIRPRSPPATGRDT